MRKFPICGVTAVLNETSIVFIYSIQLSVSYLFQLSTRSNKVPSIWTAPHNTHRTGPLLNRHLELCLHRNCASLSARNEVHSWLAEPQNSAAFFNLPDFLAFCRHSVDEARASGASLFHTVLHLNIAALLCFSERQPGEVHSHAHRAVQGRRPSQVTQLLQALPVSADGPPSFCTDWLRYWRIIE